VESQQRQILILAAWVLIPSLLTAIVCWPLLARSRKFAPFLVLLSWLAGSAAAGFLLLHNSARAASPLAVLSTALIFLLLRRA